MKGAIKLLIFCLALIVVFKLFVIWAEGPRNLTLQSFESADGKHRVTLSRSDWIDRNYFIFVEGRQVYRSPDFAPRTNLPFREALVWDTTGNVVMLEVARHRIAGYDIAAKRLLSDDELLSMEAAPDPPLAEYFFEGEWPGIGRAWK